MGLCGFLVFCIKRNVRDKKRKRTARDIYNPEDCEAMTWPLEGFSFSALKRPFEIERGSIYKTLRILQ